MLGILRQLHEEGTTVILITHDNAIAAQADRIVRMMDGKIIDDSAGGINPTPMAAVRGGSR
ncbi:hypothetical protein SDC9_102302 [bioreactor metagenome]|uniref:Macrolide export ATP-binding/permease protein MacB n=1 Tax=bioreactor metagenome TaxID=1076179 RepID=A0A645AQF8_9ZZZZ